MRMVAKILGIVLGVITIILGLYCLFTPGMAYLSLGYCVGFAMVMDSITEICFWWVAKSEGKADGWILAGAILSLVFGFFVLNSALLRLSIDIFIAYYVAIWLIIRGGIVIARAFQLRKYHHDYNTIKVLGSDGTWSNGLTMEVPGSSASLFRRAIVFQAVAGVLPSAASYSCPMPLATISKTAPRPPWSAAPA